MNALAKPRIFDDCAAKVRKVKLPRRTKFRPTRNSAVRTIEITDEMRAAYTAR